jgi:hypothetical protein
MVGSGANPPAYVNGATVVTVHKGWFVFRSFRSFRTLSPAFAKRPYCSEPSRTNE